MRPSFGQSFNQIGVFDGSNTMTDPLRVQLFNCLYDAVCSCQLARMGNTIQTVLSDKFECWNMRINRKIGFIACKVDSHNALFRVFANKSCNLFPLLLAKVP